jgi:putative transposase
VIRLLEEAARAGARREKACQLLGLSLRSVQRWQQAGDVKEDGRRAAAKLRVPAHALSAEERARVLALANRAEFADKTPHQIVPLLADRGEYVASESSFYRILRAERQLAHRGRAKPPSQKRPEPLVASAIHQLWSWDITYLASTVRGRFFYLYLIIDLYSRKIVGWEVYAEESSAHAACVFAKAHRREGVGEKPLTLHSDNGSPMKGATMLATLHRLGVVSSFSRPSVSNDNAYSEALFRTLKYTPAFPERPFETLEQARAWVAEFVHWYNEAHRHSALRFVTPGQRHRGEDQALLAQRKALYAGARARYPERWSGQTRNWHPAGAVSLNPNRSPAREVKTDTQTA